MSYPFGSPFVGQQNPPVFGSSTSQQNAFGAPSVFGQQPVFGQTTSSSVGTPGTVFGQVQATSVGTQPGLFGRSATPPPPSYASTVFGQQLMFGQTTTSSAVLSIGSVSSPGTVFGQVQATTIGNQPRLFGSNATPPSPSYASSVFGQVTGFGQGALSGPSSGGTESSVFSRPSTTTSVETPNVFGGTTFGDGSNISGTAGSGPFGTAGQSFLIQKSTQQTSSSFAQPTTQSNLFSSGGAPFGRESSGNVSGATPIRFTGLATVKSEPLSVGSSSTALFGKQSAVADSNVTTLNLFGKCTTAITGSNFTKFEKVDGVKPPSFGAGYHTNIAGNQDTKPRGLFSNLKQENEANSVETKTLPSTIFGGSSRLQENTSTGSTQVGDNEESKPSLRRQLSEENSNKVAITCRKVPHKYNTAMFLRTHFKRFGEVTKVFPNQAKMQATVHFKTHVAAAEAKTRGHILAQGVLPMMIFWTRYAVTSSGTPKATKSFPDVDVKPTRPVQRSSDIVTSMFEGCVARTTSERVNLLRLRDKYIRQNRVKGKKDMVKAFVGTCPDICPEKERYDREDKCQLSYYEIIPGTENIPGRNPQVDHNRAVKEYLRSSLDQDEPLPHELRPIPVLQSTMIYLLREVANRGEDGRWGLWFDFLWNRTRGIRKDIIQQQLNDRDAVDLIEKCARFHIYCSERLCEEDMHSFDAKINNENLTKCLQTLKEFYADLEKKHEHCQNEAEFRAYMVLMNLNQGDILSEVQQLRPEIRTSPAIKFALQAYFSLSGNNYIKFFRLVKQASFSDACIMHRYFTQVRNRALLLMMRGYGMGNRSAQIPVRELVRLLGFESDSEAIGFSQHYGFNVNDGEVVLDKAKNIEPNTAWLTVRSVILIESKLMVSPGEVINGGSFSETKYLSPVSSFDENGRFHSLIELPEKASISQATASTQPPSNIQPAEVQVKLEPAQEVTETEPAVETYKSSLKKVPVEFIKDSAKFLFWEVIDEMCKGIGEEVKSEVDAKLEVEMAECNSALDWQDNKTIAEACHHMLTSRLATDVEFSVGNQKGIVKAHKFILICRSSVFQAMFTNDFADSREIINIPDIELGIFEKLLSYMYTDETEINGENVLPLLYTAKKYSVQKLVRECLKFLDKGRSPENICDILEQAHLYDEEEFREKSVRYILENAGDVLKSPSFLELCQACVKRVVAYDELQADERTVLEAVTKWGEHRCKKQNLENSNENLRTVLGDILYLVRFPLLGENYFTNVVSDMGLLTDAEKVELFKFFCKPGFKTDTFSSRNRFAERWHNRPLHQ